MNDLSNKVAYLLDKDEKIWQAGQDPCRSNDRKNSNSHKDDSKSNDCENSKEQILEESKVLLNNEINHEGHKPIDALKQLAFDLSNDNIALINKSK